MIYLTNGQLLIYGQQMSDEPDVSKPLHGAQAKKLIAAILKTGKFGFLRHARDEMAADNLRKTDVVNVLERGSIHEPAEPTLQEEWRYRIHTDHICVVVCFRSPTNLTVVTAWRKEGGKR